MTINGKKQTAADLLEMLFSDSKPRPKLRKRRIIPCNWESWRARK